MESLINIEHAQNNLLDCAAYLAERIKSRDGYGEAMREIVPRYLQKKEIDLAAQLADVVEDPFVRDKLLIETAATCAAVDDDEYALQLVESIEDYGLQSQAREQIALEKSAKGEFQKAFEITGALDHADRAFCEIAALQFAAGKETEAMQTVERIDFPELKVKALQSIAHQVSTKGDEARASELLELGAATANEIEFPEEKMRALCETGNYYIEANRNDKAIEIFDRAKSFAERHDSANRDYFLAEIALGFLRAGSLDLADRTLDFAMDKTQIASALLGFAQAFWQRGERDDAAETLEESYSILKSERDKEVRNSRARFALFVSIAVVFAHFERAERAMEIAQEIADETEQTNALAQIAAICAAQDNDELVHQAVKAINDDAQKMFALVGVSDAKKRAGKQSEAIEVLNEAAHLAETVPQLSARSQVLNELAKRFSEYGETERARELCLENLQTISEIRDETTRAVALAQLGDVYEAGNFELNEAEKAITQLLLRRAEF